MKESRVLTALRFLADPRSGIGGKLFLLFAVLYVIFPFDLVPDVVIVLGWLDDLAVVLGATSTLLMGMKSYREKRAAKMAARTPVQQGYVGPRVVDTEGREVN